MNRLHPVIFFLLCSCFLADLSLRAQDGNSALEQRIADANSDVERLDLELELVKERKKEGSSGYAEPLPRIIREAGELKESLIQSRAFIGYGLYHELHGEPDSAIVFYR